MSSVFRIAQVSVFIISIVLFGDDFSDGIHKYKLLMHTDFPISKLDKSTFRDVYVNVGKSLKELDSRDGLLDRPEVEPSELEYIISGKSYDEIIEILNRTNESFFKNKNNFILQDLRISEENENTIEAELITTKRDCTLKITNVLLGESWLNSYSSLFLDNYIDFTADSLFITISEDNIRLNEFLERIVKSQESFFSRIFNSKDFKSMIADNQVIEEMSEVPFKVISWYFDKDDIFNVRINPQNELKLDLNFDLKPLVSGSEKDDVLLLDYQLAIKGDENSSGLKNYILPLRNADYVVKITTNENELIDIPLRVNAKSSDYDDNESFYSRIKYHLTGKKPVSLSFEYKQPRGYFLNSANPDSSFFIEEHESVESKLETDIIIKEMETLNAYYLDISTGSFRYEQFLNILGAEEVNRNTFLYLTNGQHYLYGDYKKTKDIRSFDKVQTPNTFLDKMNQFRDFAMKYDYNRGVNPVRYKHNLKLLLSTTTVDYNLSRKGYTTDVFAERISDIKKSLDAKEMFLYYPVEYQRELVKFEGLEIIKK
ncbi:MAG: hypothetical protein JXR90_17900 [Spirochaetes bacterium]|nr:hypothetical protein [Spirochaetota bacterium]